MTLVWISGAINIPTSPTSSVASLTTSTKQAKGLQQVSRFQNRFQHRVVRIQGSNLWTISEGFKLVCGHHLVCGNFQRVNVSTEISAKCVLDFVLVCRPMHGALAEISVNYRFIFMFFSNFSCKNNMFTRNVSRGVLS